MKYVNKDEQVQNKGINSQSSQHEKQAVQAQHVGGV